MDLRTILEGKDLKGLAIQVADDINGDILEDTVEHVVAGNQGGDNVYKHLVDTIDTTKKNYGKRGSNLISYVGSIVITTEYGVNTSQAASIFKKMDKAIQDKFNKSITNALEQLEKELEE